MGFFMTKKKREDSKKKENNGIYKRKLQLNGHSIKWKVS